MSPPQKYLHEIALFTDNVDRLADFCQRLLNTAPIYRAEGLAISSATRTPNPT